MRIAFRADSGPVQGTGHVMRCLTLANELHARNLEVVFFTSSTGSKWLKEVLSESPFSIIYVDKNSLDLKELKEFNLVVVDSYEIQSQLISELNEITPVLAIVDGNTRGVIASMYLDQNLGSDELLRKSNLSESIVLAGSKFALVRPEVADLALSAPSKPAKNAHIFSFFGGTDPGKASFEIAKIFKLLDTRIHKTILAPTELHSQINQLSITNLLLIKPNPDVFKYIHKFDAVISAAGTSAWELNTIGIPTAFVEIADNQHISIKNIETFKTGLVLGNLVDLKLEKNYPRFVNIIDSLLFNQSLRIELHANCQNYFDGHGTKRVGDHILEFLSRCGNL